MRKHRLMKTRTWIIILCVVFAVGYTAGNTQDSDIIPSFEKIIPDKGTPSEENNFDLSLKKDCSGGVHGINFDW